VFWVVAMVFWVVARWFFGYSGWLLWCCYAVARVFWVVAKVFWVVARVLLRCKFTFNYIKQLQSNKQGNSRFTDANLIKYETNSAV